MDALSRAPLKVGAATSRHGLDDVALTAGELADTPMAP